jgi:hypothetical protein
MAITGLSKNTYYKYKRRLRENNFWQISHIISAGATQTLIMEELSYE